MNIMVIVLCLLIVLILVSVYLIYHKLNNLTNNKLDDYANLQIAYAKLEVEFNNLHINEQKLAKQITEQVQQIEQLNNNNSQLQQNLWQITATKDGLIKENQKLTQSYSQLELLLQELKKQLGDEFLQMKTLAISELSIQAANSLRDVGKENVVLPLQEHLKDLQNKIKELDYQTKAINENSKGLNEQAKNLALALTKDSKKKGDFGEMILANLLESVGLHKQVSYLEQEQLSFKDKRLIHDLILKLPHNKAIIIDSKNLMKAYYDGIVGQEDKTQAILSALKQTLKSLSGKEYIAAVAKELERVVFEYSIVFIPNEGLFALIMEEDQRLAGALLREAYLQKIFIAGPSTLLVLLGIIEHSWSVYQTEERATQILDLARDLVIKFKSSLQYLADLGVEIRQSGEKYDALIGALDNGTSASALAKLDKLSSLAGEKQLLKKFNLIAKIAPRLPHSI